MTENNYNTLWELFEDIRKYSKENDAEIVSADNNKTLRIGWTCVDTYFFVRLTQLRNRSALKLPFENKEMYSLLTELIINTEGRKRLTLMLNSKDNSMFDIFDRMLRPKVFW